MVDRRYERFLGLLVVLLGCAQTPAPPPPPAASPAAVRAAIDSQFTKLFDAYRSKDGVAFAAIYATDAMLRSAEGTLTGRSAIQDDFTRGLASVVSVADDTATTEDFLATDDRAVQTGHIVWTETDKGKKPVKTRLDFALTWRKDADGVWRIARDLDAETHP